MDVSVQNAPRVPLFSFAKPGCRRRREPRISWGRQLRRVRRAGDTVGAGGMSRMGSPEIEVDLAHGQEELSELLAAALVLEGSEEVRLRIGRCSEAHRMQCRSDTAAPTYS